MHSADAFIQSDFQCSQVIHFSLGIEPTTLCVANAMLYHWATGALHIIKHYYALAWVEQIIFAGMEQQLR